MQKVYAFIDSQNLNLGIRDQGWKLDFARFRVYLKDKYKVSKAFLFIGFIEKNQKMYDFLESAGYKLVFKPVVIHNGKPKGNVDAELVVWTMKSVYEGKCDKVIIVTGDGDFAILADFLLTKKKLSKFIVPNRKKMSVLIKRVFVKRKSLNKLTWLNIEKEVLKHKKRPLYRSGHR